MPVPSTVAALASEIARELPRATARTRGEHTLGVKRLASDRATYNRLEAQTREKLRGQPAFEAQVSEIGIFEEAAVGTSPVVYLAVESPGLIALHQTLTEELDTVNDDIEGESYIPHVTIARGGSVETARRVADREIEPITWTVTELTFWDAKHSQPMSAVSLPA